AGSSKGVAEPLRHRRCGGAVGKRDVIEAEWLVEQDVTVRPDDEVAIPALRGHADHRERAMRQLALPAGTGNRGRQTLGRRRCEGPRDHQYEKESESSLQP